MELHFLSRERAPAATGQRQRELLHHQRPEGCSIRRSWQVIDLPRSTFYYRPTAHTPPIGDSDLAELIGNIQDDPPGYGYRRVTLELPRRGVVVNHKHVRRAMRAHGLGVKPRQRFVRTTNRDHSLPIFLNLYRNVIPTRPDVVWVGDITYLRLAAGFCYLAALLYAFSRKVVGDAI